MRWSMTHAGWGLLVAKRTRCPAAGPPSVACCHTRMRSASSGRWSFACATVKGTLYKARGSMKNLFDFVWHLAWNGHI